MPPQPSIDMDIEFRQLRPSDSVRLFRLRRRALIGEPFAFLASLEDDKASSAAAVRDHLSSLQDGSAVFGAVAREMLIAMAGLTRDRRIKAAHRACIWGVYVAPEYRRQRVGYRMLSAMLEHARQMDGLEYVYLSVSEKTPAAKRLYESLGFVVWGIEPDCIRVDGESAREYHLSLSLDAVA